MLLIFSTSDMSISFGDSLDSSSESLVVDPASANLRSIGLSLLISFKSHFDMTFWLRLTLSKKKKNLKEDWSNTRID